MGQFRKKNNFYFNVWMFFSCYFLAILPLPASLNGLPQRELIAYGTFDESLRNNLLHSTIDNKPFFAYIAESYVRLPKNVKVF